MDLNEQLDSIGATGTEHREWRIFGPPGTGKTTHIKKQVTRAVEKYGPEAVMVTSFSKAAAAELAGRNLPIDPSQIGTLHAHCYRALGRPDLAEANVRSWNEANPRQMISVVRDNSLDPPDENSKDEAAAEGNRLLASVNRWRNRLMPEETWPDKIARQFHHKWTDWKKANHYLDYTDLLETAGRNCSIAPGNPKVIFADEAQDFTKMQLTLIRKWGSFAEYFVTVGDDDQTIYEFTGATPDAFLQPPVPDRQKIVLHQSYRVPQAVHSMAMTWIEQVKHREPKIYQPTSQPGRIHYLGRSWRQSEYLVHYAMNEVAAGRTVMFLGACAYMLNKVRDELIDQAIPFWNPYRLKRGDWNPLRTGHGISASDRLQSFAIPHHSQKWNRPWTAKEFLQWADWIEARGNFVRGGKSAAAKLPPEEPITKEQLEAWLEPAQYESLMCSIMDGSLTGHLRWWSHRVMTAHKRTADFPTKVAVRQGIETLTKAPQIILGTIHSVKGGEADTVILFPDLSMQGYMPIENHRIDGIESIYRQFYVGLTRARHTLAICDPEGGYCVRFPDRRD